jgi:hypothetical protein
VRIIAGALLIVAASVCFAGGIVAYVTRNRNATAIAAVEEYGFGVAAILGLFGLVLLFIGLAKDRQQ